VHGRWLRHDFLGSRAASGHLVFGITLKTVGGLHIEVNWCRSGEEPASDPFVFWSYDEALKFLKEEFEYLAYHTAGTIAAEHLNGYREAITRLQLLRGALHAGRSEVEDCVFIIGDLCYWLRGLE